MNNSTASPKSMIFAIGCDKNAIARHALSFRSYALLQLSEVAIRAHRM